MHEPSGTTIPRETVVVRPARSADLDAMAAIERVSFPTPWSRSLLASEIAQTTAAVYLVATIDDAVRGFIGMWYALDEAHICTLAVATDQRRRGLGELLVLAALGRAIELGAEAVHLEYRAGNEPAARLYEKLGFELVGRREGYYSDTGEDAILARIDGLDDPAAREWLVQSWARWRRERSLNATLMW